MNEKGLFRQEAIDNKKNRNFGEVFINTPVKYHLFTGGVLLIILLMILFFIFGEFSEKFIVTGFVESTKGVASIYTNKNGVIVRSYAEQGGAIKKGDKLFLIHPSYDGLSQVNQHNALWHLEQKKQAIEEDIQYKEKQLERLIPLLEKKYIPLSLYQTKRDELLLLKNNERTVELELINYKQEHSVMIRSPVDGVISSVIYQQGQYTNLTKPLMKILPSRASLMAVLYIPVKYVGYLGKNSTVILRYDAYPYTRFGTSKAKIHDLSQSVLTDDEEEKPIRIGQPYYKATAILEKPFVSIYGKFKKIQQGMTFTAVVVGSKRKIWQWVLDPIYSVYGGIVT